MQIIGIISNIFFSSIFTIPLAYFRQFLTYFLKPNTSNEIKKIDISIGPAKITLDTFLYSLLGFFIQLLLTVVIIFSYG